MIIKLIWKKFIYCKETVCFCLHESDKPPENVTGYETNVTKMW